MPKKLFTVTIETEIVVAAEDELDAEDLANRTIRELDDFSIRVSPMRYLPSEWELTSLPFEDLDNRDDCTIEEYVAQGAAPDFTKMQDTLRRGT